MRAFVSNDPSAHDRWLRLPLARPRAVLVLAALALAVGLAGLRDVAIETDYRIFFGADNPQLRVFEALQDEYSRGDGLLFVAAPRDGTIYTVGALTALAELTEAAWQLPYAQRVDSLANFQHSTAAGDELTVAPLIADAAKLDAPSAGALRDIVAREPLLLNRLVSHRGHVGAVYVTLAFPEQDLAREQPQSVLAGRALLRQFQARHPGIEWRLTGRVALNYAFREAVLHDVRTIVPLALGVALACVGGMILWVSRSVTSAAVAALGVALVVLLSVVLTEALAGQLGLRLNIVTANAPTLILTLAVADCLHLFMTALQRLQAGTPKGEAIRDSLRINFWPVFLTSATTAIGFLTLNFSDVPPFRALGTKVALGTAIAWLMALTVFPALLTLAPIHWRGRAAVTDGQLPRLATAVVAARRPLLVIAALLAAGSVAGLFRNELNDNWAEYFSARTPVRQDIDFLNANLSGIHTIEFSLASGETQGVADPDYLALLEAFTRWLEAQPEVRHVYSIVDTFRRLNQNMHGDDPGWRRLPADRETAAQYLLLYELSLPMGLELTDRVNFDKSAARVTATLGNVSTRELLDLQRRAQDWLARHAPPGMGHPGSSASVMFAHIGQRNAVSMLQGTALALVLIAGSLALVYRSWIAGAASLLVMALPTLAGFGVWGLLVGRVGVGLSVVSGMIVGIVVDYTVHFLSKFADAQREGHDPPGAVRYAFGTVGLALVVTTVVLCVNFGLIGLSDFAMNAHMGILSAGMILLALCANLLVLPPLLLVLGFKARTGGAAATPEPAP